MPSLANFLLHVAIIGSSCCSAEKTDNRPKLASYLLNNITDYNSMLLPRLNPMENVYVDMDVMLSHIVSVEPSRQSMKISAYIQARWDEERLVWDPKDFGNIAGISWDSAKIWNPVILLYNGIGDNQLLTPQMPVYLTSQNQNLTHVYAKWRREFEFSCDFDMSNFPIDSHICELLFFFNDGEGLVRPKKMGSLNERGIYRNSSEWNLVNVSTYAENKLFELVLNKPLQPIPTYVVRIEIHRVSTYYFMNIIIPLLLLSLLQVLVYFLPLESGEKLGFGITIMLSYTVFLLLLDGIMPKSQSTPAIASFITAAMILSTISLFLTSVIMRFHFAPDGTRMPACARAVFVRFLGRLFCVSGAAQVDQTPFDVSEFVSDSSVRKAEGGVAVRSDWVLAAQAMERFMVFIGFVATAVIIAIFVVKPYAMLFKE